jgi:hypothetical protein
MNIAFDLAPGRHDHEFRPALQSLWRDKAPRSSDVVPMTSSYCMFQRWAQKSATLGHRPASSSSCRLKPTMHSLGSGGTHLDQESADSPKSRT